MPAPALTPGAAVATVQVPANGVSANAWEQAGWLPCQLRAEVSLAAFTVGDLLRLEAGSIVDSGVGVEADLLVSVNGARVGCGKLDPVGERLAVRLTELV